MLEIPSHQHDEQDESKSPQTSPCPTNPLSEIPSATNVIDETSPSINPVEVSHDSDIIQNLYSATVAGNSEVVTTILQEQDGTHIAIPLMLSVAAHFGYKDLVELFLGIKDIDLSNPEVYQLDRIPSEIRELSSIDFPLCEAASNGHLELVTLLMSDQRTHASARQAFKLAFVHEQREIVKLFLELTNNYPEVRLISPDRLDAEEKPQCLFPGLLAKGWLEIIELIPVVQGCDHKPCYELFKNEMADLLINSQKENDLFSQFTRKATVIAAYYADLTLLITMQTHH